MKKMFILFFLLIAPICSAEDEWYDYINEMIDQADTQEFSKVIIKAIAWCESRWKQFDDKGRPFVCNKDWGIMQINEETVNMYGWNWLRIKYDTQYNLEKGVIALNEKIKYVKRLKQKKEWPKIKKKIGIKNDSDLYLAIWAYNGLGKVRIYPNTIIQLVHTKPWERHLKPRLKGKKNEKK